MTDPVIHEDPSGLTYKVSMVSPRPQTVASSKHERSMDKTRCKKKIRQQGVSRPSRNFDEPRPKIFEEVIQVNTFLTFEKITSNLKLEKEKKKIKQPKKPVEYDYKKQPIMLEKDIKLKTEEDITNRLLSCINYDPNAGHQSTMGFGSSGVIEARAFLKSMAHQ